MTQIFSIGIAGLKAAEQRVSIAAQNIANTQSAGYVRLRPEQVSQGGHPVVTARPDAGVAPFDGLADDLVSMRIAQHSHSASAAIIRTGDEMTRRVLDLFA
ncbi:MAG TPA: hypothetical protein DCL54_14370 [Alphaproteobacteria bacterium]|nr:hypothetical protein [Alphaproteobacteria bacterium]